MRNDRSNNGKTPSSEHVKPKNIFWQQRRSPAVGSGGVLSLGQYCGLFGNGCQTEYVAVLSQYELLGRFDFPVCGVVGNRQIAQKVRDFEDAVVFSPSRDIIINMDTINTTGYFLLYRLPEQRGYVGAILVVDNEGIPLEFKCTEAIRPTHVQQSLYGNTMEMYIAVKLCAIPLLKAVSNKPDMLFVNEQSFLTIREETEIPTLFVRQTDNVSDDMQPSIALMPHSQFEADKEDELIRRSGRFDLIEPFDRVQQAVLLLGEKDERFR